jgi:hypothetical protein
MKTSVPSFQRYPPSIRSHSVSKTSTYVGGGDSSADAIRRTPIEIGGKNTHLNVTLVPDDAPDPRFPRLATPLSYGQGPAHQVPFRVKKRVLHVASGDEVSMQRNKSKAFPSPGLAESRTPGCAPPRVMDWTE